MLEKMFVYRLIDPRDGATFYVGITDDFERRYYHHKVVHGRGKKKVARIKDIQASGLQPIMELLTTVFVDVTGVGSTTIANYRYTHKQKAAETVETAWIAFYTSIGISLANTRTWIHRCYCDKCA